MGDDYLKILVKDGANDGEASILQLLSEEPFDGDQQLSIVDADVVPGRSERLDHERR